MTYLFTLLLCIETNSYESCMSQIAKIETNISRTDSSNGTAHATTRPTPRRAMDADFNESASIDILQGHNGQRTSFMTCKNNCCSRTVKILLRRPVTVRLGPGQKCLKAFFMMANRLKQGLSKHIIKPTGQKFAAERSLSIPSSCNYMCNKGRDNTSQLEHVFVLEI